MDNDKLREITETITLQLIEKIKENQGDIGEGMIYAGELTICLAQLGKIAVRDFSTDPGVFGIASGEVYDYVLALAGEHQIPPFDFMIILGNLVIHFAQYFQEIGATGWPDDHPVD